MKKAKQRLEYLRKIYEFKKGTIKVKKGNILFSIIFILVLSSLTFVQAQEQHSLSDPYAAKPVKLLRTFGKGLFGQINNIYVSPKGVIYVSDAGDCTIKAFNMRYEFLFSFAGKKQSPGSDQKSKLQSILELYSDKDSNVYAADYNQNLVNVYDSSGKYLSGVKP
ncbi:MAG: hypothetical protein AB1498_12365 [bacterium]